MSVSVCLSAIGGVMDTAVFASTARVTCRHRQYFPESTVFVMFCSCAACYPCFQRQEVVDDIFCSSSDFTNGIPSPSTQVALNTFPVHPQLILIPKRVCVIGPSFFCTVVFFDGFLFFGGIAFGLFRCDRRWRQRHRRPKKRSSSSPRSEWRENHCQRYRSGPLPCQQQHATALP